MGERYAPELGQAMFGQPWRHHCVPALMSAALDAIGYEIERVVGNVQQKQFTSPRSNSATAFSCAVFGMWAYDWGDETQPCNFHHLPTGLIVNWYKYGGRGESANMEITPDLASRVLEDCLKACRACDGRDCDGDPEHPFLAGHNGEVPYFESAGAYPHV